MTAVLEKLIYEEVCPREVVDWLTQKNPNVKDNENVLTALNSLRGSFVQFFINHLRSQTAQLTFHGQTTFASPAGKANKLFKALQQQTSKLVQTPTTTSSHRSKVNLFQSPASTDFSDVSLLETSNSSIDTSGSFLDSSIQREEIKHASNRSFSSLDGDHHSTKSFEKLSKPLSAKMDRRSKKSRSYGMQKTGGNKNRSRSNASVSNTAHDFSIDSLKDFPSIGSSKSVTSTPRRITPTAVSTPLSTSSVHSSFGDESSSPWIPETSPGNFGSSRNYSGKASLEDERDLLKMVKADKTKQISLSRRFSPQSPGEKANKFSLFAADAVVPEMNKVTFVEQLKVLIQLYSIMLEELLIPNVWMELYFLIQLLTVKGTVGETRCYNYCYLTTVHNAVYFAVEVLSKLTRYLAMLDKPTLNLLCENDAIQKFKPPFHNKLMVLWDRTSLSLSSSSKPNSILASVPFHVETDNRENFPSDKSFHCFKKQRDKFYELLREWQVQHTIPGWSMHVTMATRIRELIAMATDITNTFHFAKLFTSQLIKMCLEDQDQIASLHENFLLNHLKMENPDKLKRLEERFTTPSSVVGPCPPPQFQGCQEFFRSFIIEADSYIFNQHLMDCISARIQELNKFSYLPDQGITSSGSLPDKELKDQFIACLQTMQILAKFLGLIKFLPYKQTERVSEKLKEEIMAGRPKEPYQMDILSSLQSGYHQQRLVLVVPWLVEYLSMMDTDAATLEYYQMTFKLLSFVYRIIGTSGADQFPPCNQFLLLLYIGWLFEVQSQSPDLLQPLGTVQIDQSNDFREPPLDHIPFIDKQFLYSSCPYLSDVRCLLSESTTSSPMRKITPIAADATASSNSFTTEFNISQVQVDLERNFFHTQSPSLKKSVEFVGSRVASNCIKYIDSNLLMSRRKSLADHMMALFQNASTADGDMLEFRKEAQECMDQACKKTVQEAEETGKRFVERKCQVLIRNMVAEDASVQLQQTACSIAVRNSLQKFQRWIHLQIPGAFRQELESTLQKCLKIQTTKVGQPPSELNPRSDSTADVPPEIGPSRLLQELKDAVYTLIISPDPSKLGQDLYELILKTKAVLCGRKDLTHTSSFAIEHLLKDLFALTCMIHPRCVTNPSVAVEPFKELTDKLNNVIISPQDDHNSKDSKAIKCPVGGCPFRAMMTSNTNDDTPCLIHEFVLLCKDCFSSKLTHKHFMSTRTEYIGAVGSSVMADKDFCKIYDYMKEIQLIEDEVT